MGIQLRQLKPSFFGLLLGFFWATLTAPAASSPVAAPATTAPKSVYDRIWQHADWYHNAENPVLQRLQFTGRFQLDYAVVDAHQGSHDEWNIRRFRAGLKAGLFKHFTLHAEADLNPQEAEPVYERLTDMYLAWSRNKSFKLTVGKQGANFTSDGMTSSKELLTLDRGNLANNLWFPQEYMPGVTMSGEPGRWRYVTGVFSSGSANREFGEFDGGVFLLGTVGYDFGPDLGVKQAVLAANLVRNEPDVHNTFTRALEHVASINFSLDTGRWGVRTDLAAANGYLGQSDLWGFMVTPFYNITDHFQAVVRYSHVESDRRNGVRLARYENEVVTGRGNEYDEIYAGLNYYFYKHKLKLQTGVQYAEMRDTANDGGAYRGWAWTTGLRISW